MDVSTRGEWISEGHGRYRRETEIGSAVIIRHTKRRWAVRFADRCGTFHADRSEWHTFGEAKGYADECIAQGIA